MKQKESRYLKTLKNVFKQQLEANVTHCTNDTYSNNQLALFIQQS